MCLLRKRKELERQRDFYQQRFNEILAKYDEEQKKTTNLETENFELNRTIDGLRGEITVFKNEVEDLMNQIEDLKTENLAKHNIIVENNTKMKNLQKKLEKLQKENPATRVEAKKPGEPRKKEQKPEKPTSRLESSERKVDHDSYIDE